MRAYAPELVPFGIRPRGTRGRSVFGEMATTLTVFIALIAFMLVAMYRAFSH
jgi:hypothetical protein